MAPVEMLFFPAGFQSGGPLVESSLHVDHTKLPVFALAVAAMTQRKKLDGPAPKRSDEIHGHEYGIASRRPSPAPDTQYGYTQVEFRTPDQAC
jgi:hypothetical protein